MADLTRERILGMAATEIVTVSVPAWSGRVYLRSLTMREREQYEAASWIVEDGKIRAAPGGDRRARLLILCLATAEGHRLFRDEDLEAVASLPAAATEGIYLAALRLNGMDAESLEAFLGNSGGARSGGRSSVSLAISG